MKHKFSLFLLLPLLFSCSPTTSSHSRIVPKVPLFHYEANNVRLSDRNDYMFHRLFVEDLNSYLEKKASFALYVYGAGCGTCDLFSMTVKDYILKTNAVINFMYLNEYLETEHALNLTQSSFLFYHEGELIDSISTLDDYAYSKTFETFMDERTYDTHITLLNSSYQDETIRTTFNTYTLTSFITPLEEKQYFVPIQEYIEGKLAKEKAHVLWIADNQLSLPEIYEELKNYQGYSAFISEEILSDNSIEFSEIVGEDIDLKTLDHFTMIYYEDTYRIENLSHL